MSCEIVNKIGTGDCEILEKIKSEDNATAVASDLVSEIINNALDIAEERGAIKVTGNVGDILENLSTKFQELIITEDKQKLADVSVGPFQGVGDQLEDDVDKKSVVQHRPVEKKNRLTDLVKNSKQLLAKLMLNESKGELHDTKSEKFVKAIELDSKDHPYKVKKSVVPEDVRLPSDDSEEILQERSGDEESLDEIQLSVSQVEDFQVRDELKKTLTFPLAGPSKKSFMDRYRTIKLAGDFKKKKWNVGSRIIDYIRKQKSKIQSSNTTDGIEITPQTDNYKF